MRVKSFKGKVFGADLTAAERKAMDIEISRQLVERDKQYAEDIDAMVLYALMMHKGWKRKRLKDFWKAFTAIHKELREFYLLESQDDNRFVAHRKLREIGVDIHQWYEEDKENE